MFRSFNYDTISDVVLHIQYTAALPANTSAVEAATGGVSRALRNTVPPHPRPLRLFISVRHDFPAESRQLLESGVDVNVVLDDRLFPYFARNRASAMTVTRLLPDGTAVELEPPPIVDGLLRLSAVDAEGYLIVNYALV